MKSGYGQPYLITGIAVLLLIVLCGTASAQEEPLKLTLKEAITMAVEKNLDVRAELYNPAGAEATIRQNKGIYDPLLTLLANYQDSTTLPASIFLAGVTTSKQRILQYNAGASQLIPTGATLGAEFNNTWNRNNSDPSRGFLDKYYQSNVTVTLSQPLLKNFGRAATDLNINVAIYGKEATLEHYKSKLLATVAQVRTEYFKLYSLRENLEVKKTSLALAQKILSDTQAQVKAGVLPAMEILNAQFGASTREKELIDAERALKDQMDLLRLLLQLDKPYEIDPINAPPREKFEAVEEDEIKRALANRPDLLESQANLKASDLQARVARNQTLPSLNLNASAAMTGLGPEYNRDLERVTSGNYPVWSVGLQLDYPIGNRAAENTYIKSKLKVEQAKTQIKSIEEGIQNDVRTAIRAIVSNYKQLDVADQGSAYAEERLRAYIKKNAVGLATTKDVLDVQNDLVTAKNNQIQAVVNYVNAVTQLWQVTGALLEKEGITVNAKEADALYEKNR